MSSCSPSRFRSASASSISSLANFNRSSFTSSGERVASTPRRLPSRVSLAIWWISPRSRSSSRSTALLNTCGGSEAIFTFAIPCTSSGMPPREKAFSTFTSIGMVRSGIRLTRSISGTRKVRPPRTMR